MFLDTGPVRDYFLKLGLSQEIADIYLALHAFGPQNISELARRSGVERTRIYRLIDDLRSSGLVEVEVRYKQNIFHPAPVTNLQAILAKKEQDLRDLQARLPAIQRQLESTDKSNPTRLQSYRGADGVRQMFWNQTRAKGESVSILYENIQIRTNEAFFSRWVRRCNEQGLAFRSVVGDNFIASQQKWYSQHDNEKLARWKGRYIADTIFPIAHSTVIYDAVTAYYNWKGGEIFGLEIHNQQIADAQRAFFDMLWTQGLPIEGHGHV